MRVASELHYPSYRSCFSHCVWFRSESEDTCSYTALGKNCQIMFLRTFGRRRPPTVAPRSINLFLCNKFRLQREWRPLAEGSKKTSQQYQYYRFIFLYLSYHVHVYVFFILFVYWAVVQLILLGQTIRQISVIYPSNIRYSFLTRPNYYSVSSCICPEF